MTLFDRMAGQMMRLGARALAAGRVEIAATGLEYIPTDGPGPFSCPSLSSSFRRCCAVSLNTTSGSYLGDLGLGKKQLRSTFNHTGHYNGTLASRPAQRCSKNMRQPGGSHIKGDDPHSHRHQTLSTKRAQ
jgi:hypothetical protein